jgi:homoserine kinase type II
MAVFTEVSADAAGEFLRDLNLGELVELQGIQGGIENTNYFVTSEREGQTRQWVLTLFERLSFEQLPFYLYLMKHLAQRGIPVPDPQGNASGDIVHTVCGKPAALVDRLRGRSELAPTEVHCAGVGAALARMHLAGRDYDRSQPNLRGLAWWNDTVPVVLPFLDAHQTTLLQGELAYQNHVAASAAYVALPRGPVHADLFRDNVMFDTGPQGPELTGIFDFYFAGVDTWLFDLAVCLNDWCIDLPTGAHDAPRARALLDAYCAQRPLTAAERRLLPAMLRAGALRFWISRLWDFHLPREASMLKPHDPAHFERVLRQRLGHPLAA